MEKKIFLLGGYDLEMQEIAALLKRRGILFFDRHLGWADATLKAYAMELEQYGNCPGVEIYGVELQDGGMAGLYGNYIRVDHHNDYSDRPSSLAQVAALLGQELTRRQQLVAANDAGYIPAMQQLGASYAEVAEIRMADREMQGCTPEDERLAELSIEKNLQHAGDLIVVYALTSRFSPICDRLWPYEKLLVHTEDTLCYYGRGKEKLVEKYQEEIVSGKMYHGGGEGGFFGVAGGYYSPEEILRLVQACKEIVVNL